MDNKSGVLGTPKSISIYLSGERHLARLISLTSEEASITLLGRCPIWYGMLASISIGDLPSFPAYVREIVGEDVTIELNPKLHPSVVDAIHGGVFERG